jgi:CHASE2 domain-containing sensor protein
MLETLTTYIGYTTLFACILFLTGTVMLCLVYALLEGKVVPAAIGAILGLCAYSSGMVLYKKYYGLRKCIKVQKEIRCSEKHSEK